MLLISRTAATPTLRAYQSALWAAAISLVFLLGGLASARAQAPPTPSPGPPSALAAIAPTVLSGAPRSAARVDATVNPQGGLRASKLIGSAVYNDRNDKVGSVDDLIIKQGDQVVMAVISVGGFLGIGSKLVAVPYHQLHTDSGPDGIKVTLPGASKGALEAMPGFSYSG